MDEFNGRAFTANMGGVSLHEVAARTELLDRFAQCFDDHRAPDKLTRPLAGFLKQRTFELCVGYEDFN